MNKHRYDSTTDKILELKTQLLSGEIILLQDTVFDFPSNQARVEYIEEHEVHWNDMLDNVGYAGAGRGYLDLDTMKIIWHEQSHYGNEPEESDNIVEVYCSCWEIQLTSATPIIKLF